MSAYHCAIRSCGARLLGFAYFTLILDNDKRIAVCPSCFRKVNAASGQYAGRERMTRRCELCGATGVLQAIGTLLVCVRQSCQREARYQSLRNRYHGFPSERSSDSLSPEYSQVRAY